MYLGQARQDIADAASVQTLKRPVHYEAGLQAEVQAEVQAGVHTAKLHSRRSRLARGRGKAGARPGAGTGADFLGRPGAEANPGVGAEAEADTVAEGKVEAGLGTRLGGIEAQLERLERLVMSTPLAVFTTPWQQRQQMQTSSAALRTAPAAPAAPAETGAARVERLERLMHQMQTSSTASAPPAPPAPPASPAAPAAPDEASAASAARVQAQCRGNLARNTQKRRRQAYTP